MKTIIRILYVIYQYLIALPIFALITLFTAITTIIFQHYRNSPWLHAIQQFWSRSFFYLLFVKVEVTGLQYIRPNQSYVFVSNHQSMADVFAIYGYLPVIFKWIMKKELRRIPFVGTACAAAGHIYIDRSSKRNAFMSLKKAEEQLHDGVCVVIFPEGTRTNDGSVKPFRRGAFSIAHDLNLPILTISLRNYFELLPKGRPYATFVNKVVMNIGPEINLNDYSQEDRTVAMNVVQQQVEKYMNIN